MFVEFPSGAVPLDSCFYVERPPVEAQVFSELETAGSVIRIRAPKGMGKGSLLLRLLNYADSLGYQQVKVDFQSAEQSLYGDLSRFLRWFCANVGRQLGLPSRLDEYWDDDIGAKLSCTLYFEDYILDSLTAPLVLSLGKVENIFEHPAIAKDFLPMLRFWHEQSKQADAFQNLRLIVCHSTEVYVPLNINQSPFNIGLPVQLKPFTPEQVQELIHRHGIQPFRADELSTFMSMLGGHPHLVRLALYHLSFRGMTLQQLLQTAPTPEGVYSEQLQSYVSTLERQPELATALMQVVCAPYPIELDPLYAYRLNSLGLILPRGDRWMPSCDLYRQYFSGQNWSKRSQTLSIAQLRRENEQLKQLVHIDELTQVANRRHLEQSLQVEWNRMARQQQQLSFILLDVDCFKLYNDTYGHPAGDHCLHQVAQALQSCSRRASDLVARYGGEEFAVLLPRTNAKDAQIFARHLLRAIRSLALPHRTTAVRSRIVTVSLGVATLMPHPEGGPADLVQQADLMLYHAKRTGRDRFVCNMDPATLKPAESA